MKSDLPTKRQFAHRANIDRYKRILGTHLTNEERHFVERRLAEERTSLEQLAGTPLYARVNRTFV